MIIMKGSRALCSHTSSPQTARVVIQFVFPPPLTLMFTGLLQAFAGVFQPRVDQWDGVKRPLVPASDYSSSKLSGEHRFSLIKITSSHISHAFSLLCFAFSDILPSSGFKYFMNLSGRKMVNLLALSHNLYFNAGFPSSYSPCASPPPSSCLTSFSLS